MAAGGRRTSEPSVPAHHNIMRAQLFVLALAFGVAAATWTDICGSSGKCPGIMMVRFFSLALSF